MALCVVTLGSTLRVEVDAERPVWRSTQSVEREKNPVNRGIPPSRECRKILVALSN